MANIKKISGNLYEIKRMVERVEVIDLAGLQDNIMVLEVKRMEVETELAKKKELLEQIKKVK